jgi:hypothetical protein
MVKMFLNVVENIPGREEILMQVRVHLEVNELKDVIVQCTLYSRHLPTIWFFLLE